MLKNKILTSLLITILLLQNTILPVSASVITGSLPARVLRKAGQTESIFDGKTYTHSDVFDGMYVYNGIDVSYYNKTIDWEEVKAAGTDFAIIRAGYRGYGASGTLCTDTKFVDNIEGALAAGIKVGVYYFTEAINTQEAVEEAEYCLEKIKDYDVTLPVVIDYEYPTNSKGPIGRMYNAKLSKSSATNNVSAFCDTIKDAGYTPMVYANKSDLATLINGTKLAKSYKIWLANYTTKTTYSGTYDYWQYSSKGTVDGISGVVDCNFWYTGENFGDGSIITSEPSETSLPAASASPSDDPGGTDNSTTVITATPKPSLTPKPSPAPKPSPTPKPDETPEPSVTRSLEGAVIASLPDMAYTGDEIIPALDVQLDGETLIEDEDYELTAENNIEPGNATVTITGIGNYSGSVMASFIIKPKKIDAISAKPAAKAITLSWSGDNGAGGYQIYRKDTFNGSFKKIKTITNGDTVSYKNTGLLTDHEYYYKIRPYSKADGKTYYNSYTTITAATMKKKQAAIIKAKIKLFKTPAIDAKKLIAIPKNSTIEYLGRTYTDDATSFLHVQYTAKSKTYNGYIAPDTVLKFYSLGKTTADLNMRKAAGIDKKILTVIPNGTPLAILKKVSVQSKIWYKTNYHDGKKLYTGFVSSNYIN